ncbi:MAG TPA: glutathione S-transferase [Ramlibacter sp.]|jgi:glutathione S-transferase|uniref:glutathione S-transferase family protein n=1 Tax=Ramlibacter sp. TaxID=1917967 RepID=UPI002D3EA78C|nr:glutathione S-transferase [Ramlibacter sp.]HZY20229.1 glutathione S-transferase [Ramlibacter sp.]
MALALHGSPISNYYNKVKLALLDKGVPFDEVLTPTGRTDEAVLAASPLGKIPFLRLDDGRALCESQPILEWIEASWPTPALLPADAFQAAKVRELATFIDWHLEITARKLYGPAFFGADPLAPDEAARLRRELEERIRAFRRLARFAPFVAGDAFTLADCCAFNHLPLVGLATRAVFGEDLLVAGGIDYKGYLRLVGERPSAQKVVADRKAAQALLR